VFAFLCPPITQAQITRGASPGEIYISNYWYSDANDDSHSAVLYSPNNGADLLLQFESLDYNVPGEMRIGTVLGDAAPGALYNYGWNELWVSLDYGESWEYREDHPDNTKYLSGQSDGVIFRIIGAELSQSENYGNTFTIITNPIGCPIRELGYYLGEFFGINGNIGEGLYLDHTLDYANTYTEIPIDSTVAFWQICGKYPEISRGTEPGELYLVSWWLDVNYKIFRSVDTGYTWTQQYESEYINLYYWGVQYTAGRQPGSFYVKRTRYDQTFTHAQVYIDYSSDYGKTFTTYFHNLDSLYTSVSSLNNPTPVLTASPNPFSDRTSITFDLPADCKTAMLNICSLQGTLIRQFDITGKNMQLWDGTDGDGCLVRNGVYLYNISFNNTFSSFNKLLFIH
jgi:hypothetical protein